MYSSGKGGGWDRAWGALGVGGEVSSGIMNGKVLGKCVIIGER